MLCPKCSEGETTPIAGIDPFVEQCDHCQGLYFDRLTKADLDTLAANTDFDSGDAEAGAKFDDLVFVDCPKCFRMMDQRFVEDPVRIRFECCPTCLSAFLDAGELTRYLDGAHRPTFTSLLPDSVSETA